MIEELCRHVRTYIDAKKGCRTQPYSQAIPVMNRHDKALEALLLRFLKSLQAIVHAQENCDSVFNFWRLTTFFLFLQSSLRICMGWDLVICVATRRHRHYAWIAKDIHITLYATAV